MQYDGWERLSARVRGRVQGVFFRAYTRERAHELGLQGWVKNEPDGTVRIEAEGPSDKLDQFVEAVQEGPPAARVEAIDAERSKPTHEYYHFDIRHR